MASYTRFAVRGTATVLIVSFLAAVLGYVVRLLMTRTLTVEQFGLFNSVFAFLGVIGAFKSLGFDKALIRFIPEFKHENRLDLIKSSMVYVMFIQLVTNTLVIIGVYALSNYLSVNFFHSSQASSVLRLLAIAFFVDSFVMVLKFTFQGFKKVGLYSWIDFTRMLLILVIISIGVKLNYGMFAAVSAYVIAPIILFIVYGWVLLTKVFPEFVSTKFIFDKGTIKKVSSYGIFVVEASLAGTVLYYTDVLALTYFSDLATVGLYSVALPTAKALMYFPRAIGGVLLPLTSELWVKKKTALLKEGIETLYKYSFIVMIPAVAMMFSFAELLITVLYGKNYAMASSIMRILSIGMVFAIIYGINVNFFAGIGKPRISAIIVYSAAAVNLIGNIILIPIIGANGAAISTTLSYFVMMLVGLLYIRRFIKIDFPIKIWIKTLFAGIIFVLIILFLKDSFTMNMWIEAAVLLAISGISYVLVLFLLKVLSWREIKSIYSRIR